MNLLLPMQIGVVQGLLLAAAVLGFALAFRMLRFPDLTIEGSVPLGAATYALLIQGGTPAAAAVVASGLAGAAAGALTATLHVRLAVNKFLAGIIVVSVLYSVTLRLMAGPNLSLLGSASLLEWPRSQSHGRFQWALLLFLGAGTAAVAAPVVLFLRSRTGMTMRAVGANPEFADSIGIHRGAVLVAGVAACNGLAGISGALLADHQGFADVGIGQGILVVALAAYAIGEALVPRRSIAFPVHVVLAAVAGCIAYHVIIALAMRAGLQPTDLRLATGALVLVVVALRGRDDQSNGEEELR